MSRMPPPRVAPQTASNARPAGGSPLAPFAVLLAIAGLALGGFCYWQLTQFQQGMQQAANLQQAAEARIAELEKRLSATGETSEQSLAALQVKLTTNGQEVAKLWSVVNDTKTKVNASVEQVQAGVNEKIQSAAKENDTKTKAAVAEVQSEIKVLQDLVEAQQSSSNKDDEARKDLAAKIADVSKRLKSLDSDLGERMRNSENAIESIDAFRLQVNREILKLKGGPQ